MNTNIEEDTLLLASLLCQKDITNISDVPSEIYVSFFMLIDYRNSLDGYTLGYIEGGYRMYNLGNMGTKEAIKLTNMMAHCLYSKTPDSLKSRYKILALFDTYLPLTISIKTKLKLQYGF